MEGFTRYFSNFRGRPRAASLGMSSFKSPPLKVARAWKRAHRDDRAISGVSFPFWTTHTHTYAVKCMHIHKHIHVHMHSINTHSCTHAFTPGTTPALQGTTGIPVTCFEEAELISLVRRWEPEDDGVRAPSDWAVSRPSCSFTLPLWNAPYNINTTTHARLHFTPVLFVSSLLSVLTTAIKAAAA